MTPEQTWVIIAALATTVASEAGFIVFLFRIFIDGANGRIASMESERKETLTGIGANVGTMLDILRVVVEIVRELKLIGEYERRSYGPTVVPGPLVPPPGAAPSPGTPRTPP
jgi:hypothetical protein